MMRPPALLHINISNGNRRRVRLWLPLFLLWPLAFVLALLVIPFWLLAGFVWWIIGRGKYILVTPWRATVLICCLPGLLVEAQKSSDEAVKIEFR